MTDRHTVDTINSDQLDALYDQLDRVRALHKRNEHTGDCEHCSARDYPDYAVPHPCDTIRALDEPPGPAATGYCPACGRGDVAPTAEAYEQQRQRAERATAALDRVRMVGPALEYEATAPGLAEPAREVLRDASRRIRAALADPTPAATEATETETTARVLSALYRSAEETVTRVIALHEQWVKSGPPPLGTQIARWWDKRLVELHDALLPLPREQRERPTHPDGTPYRYHEIKAEGWGYCEGCRMWSTGTPDPHQCPQTHIHGPATGQTKEQ